MPNEIRLTRVKLLRNEILLRKMVAQSQNLTMVKFWETKKSPRKPNSTVSRVGILRQNKNLTMVKFLEKGSVRAKKAVETAVE